MQEITTGNRIEWKTVHVERAFNSGERQFLLSNKRGAEAFLGEWKAFRDKFSHALNSAKREFEAENQRRVLRGKRPLAEPQDILAENIERCTACIALLDEQIGVIEAKVAEFERQTDQEQKDRQARGPRGVSRRDRSGVIVEMDGWPITMSKKGIPIFAPDTPYADMDVPTYVETILKPAQEARAKKKQDEEAAFIQKKAALDIERVQKNIPALN